MDDVIELVLNGETIWIAKEYDISIAYLLVPNQFSIVIGSGTTAVDLMRRYPPGTKFAIKINGIVQFMGRLDGPERPSGEATEIRFTGRDRLAQLVDDHIEHDKSFTNATFADLTKAAITGAQIPTFDLRYDAAAHRKAVVGTPIVQKDTVKKKVLLDLNQLYGIDTSGFPPGTNLNYVPMDPTGVDPTTGQTVTFHEVEVEDVVTRITGYKTEKPIEWKAGTAWYSALNTELARAGLFLRAGVDPQGQDENIFLLSEPSAAQQPLFGLVSTREPKPADNVINVGPPTISAVTTGRHATYVVRGRTGGGKDGRKQIEGRFTDEEMVGWGFDKRRVRVDNDVQTTAQANYLARRDCAMARRVNRTFTYTMMGRHTGPMLANPSKRAILAPDICVSLKDDENGLEGVFWVERVRHRATANGGTFTDITLMVPEDLVFGDGLFLPGAPPTVLGTKHRKKKTT